MPLSIIEPTFSKERYFYKPEEKNSKQKKEHIKIIKKKFKKYNPEIKESTIKYFYRTCKKFDLNKSTRMIRILSNQITVESSAKHINRSTGKITKSLGNALGITQITPTTAFYYLKNMEEDNRDSNKPDLLYKMKFSDHSFVKRIKDPYSIDRKGKKYVKGLARELTIKWLSNKKNNITLWGYIMNKKLEKYNSIYLSLLSYNIGPGKLNSFIEKNKTVTNHPYIRKSIEI